MVEPVKLKRYALGGLYKVNNNAILVMLTKVKHHSIYSIQYIG